MTTAIMALTDDNEYNKLVHTACVLEHKAKAQLLLFYWELGRVVKAATQGAADGPRSVPQFLKHMQVAAPGKITLQIDSIHNALDINEYIGREELQSLQAANVPLRSVLAIANGNISPQMRGDAIKMLVAGELSPPDVADYVKASRAQEAQTPSRGLASGGGSSGGGKGSGAAPASRTGDTKRAATIQVMRFPDFIAKVAEKMTGYDDSLDVLCSSATDEDEIDEIQRAFREGLKAMEDLADSWAEISKAARKVMDKTITTLSREERKGTAKKATKK
jgi:hypothetical protein